MSHQDDIRKLISNYSRRLQKLNEQRALAGVSVDPRVLIEIEDIEAQIEKLRIELKEIEDRVETTPQINTTISGGIYEKSQISNIRSNILDYAHLIKDKTHDFVGRQFVFEAVERFTQNYPRGYFFVSGDPGVGKSALAAEMVKNNSYVHHFNIRAEGINKADKFLKNVCAQLIDRFKLPYPLLPPTVTTDASFLNKLLGEVSQKLDQNEKTIIVVDALDEVDNEGLPSGVNPLYLPLVLPQGIYIVVTMRKDTRIHVRVECEQNEIFIKHDSASNLADIQAYLLRTLKSSGIQAYIAAQEIEEAFFIEHLVDRSQGNFMYLRYVLPEIEQGVYRDLEISALPVGLQNYYEDHWSRIRGLDEETWFNFKLPVIMALTVVREPVSIDLLIEFSGVTQRARVRRVLHEWSQFLHEEQVLYQGAEENRYSIYHASFHDFIGQKEEVADERVSKSVARRKLIKSLLPKDYIP